MSSRVFAVRPAQRLAACALALAACGPGSPPVDVDDTGTPAGTSGQTATTTPDGTSESPSNTTTTTTTASPTTGAAGQTTTTLDTDPATSIASECPFICIPDGGNRGDECDVFAQDCPQGEKCAAWANDGGSSWNALKCVPVVQDPKQPGDVCTVEGSGVSGIDDCAFGSMCWNTDDMNMGTCVALCTGSPEAPVCTDPAASCALTNDGVLNLCLPNCDPLAQDCNPGDVCIGTNADKFQCVLDASGEEGQQHDACEFLNACDPGLICQNSSAASECDPNASGCCEPFCDLTNPDADMQCGGVGQKCNAYFEMGTAPPGLENVGYCAIPQ